MKHVIVLTYQRLKDKLVSWANALTKAVASLLSKKT
jgi:hypothetical protein